MNANGTDHDSIDHAIAECDRYMGEQTKAAQRMRLYSVYFALGVFAMLAYLILWPTLRSPIESGEFVSAPDSDPAWSPDDLPFSSGREESSLDLPAVPNGDTVDQDLPSRAVGYTEGGSLESGQLFARTYTTSSYLVFAILRVFTIVFGLLIAISRFHLNEAAKIEHYKIGFMRMRIAAESGRRGFQTEVREALTKDAFAIPVHGGFRGRGKMESPVPGHPAVDLATGLMNKILESVDVTVRTKQKDNDKDA